MKPETTFIVQDEKCVFCNRIEFFCISIYFPCILNVLSQNILFLKNIIIVYSLFENGLSSL